MRTPALLLALSLLVPRAVSAAPPAKPSTSTAKRDFAKLIWGPYLQKLAWPLAFHYRSEDHAPQSPAHVGLRLAEPDGIPKDYAAIRPYRSALLELLTDLDTLSGTEVQFLVSPDSLPFSVVSYKGARCLVLTSSTSDTYNTLRLTAKQRAAKALSAQVLPLLRSLAKTFSSANVPQYAVFAVYGTRDFSLPENDGLESEVVGLVTPKRIADAYIQADMTDRQVVAGSAVLLSEREASTDFARVEVNLE